MYEAEFVKECTFLRIQSHIIWFYLSSSLDNFEVKGPRVNPIIVSNTSLEAQYERNVFDCFY